MKYIALTVLLSFCVISKAQTLYEIEWGSEYALRIVDHESDSEGYHYFACFATNLDVDSTVSVVVKTDPNFLILWSNSYQVFRRDDIACITLLEDGNLVVGGTMRQDFAFEVGSSMIKLNPDGEVIWYRVYPDSFDDRIIEIFEEDNGDLIAMVRKGVTNEPSKILVTNSEGVPQSYVELGLDGWGLGFDEAIRDGDTIYAIGDLFNSDDGGAIIHVVALTPTEILWCKRYSFGIPAQGAKITKTPNGLALLGTINDPESVLNGVNMVVLNTDNDGEIIWAKELFREGNGLSELATGIGYTDSQEIIFSYFLFTGGPIVSGISGFGLDGELFDQLGIQTEFGTIATYGTTLPEGLDLLFGNDSNGKGLVITAANSDVCSGQLAGLDVVDIDGETLDGNATITAIEFDSALPEMDVVPWPLNQNINCALTASVDDNSSDLGLIIYPNPTEDLFTLKLSEEKGKVMIYDSKGSMIRELIDFRSGESIDLSEYPNGVYQVTFQGERSIGTIKIVKTGY